MLLHVPPSLLVGERFLQWVQERDFEDQQLVCGEKVILVSVCIRDKFVQFARFDSVGFFCGGAKNGFIPVVPHSEREREEVFHWFGAETPGVENGFQVSLDAVGVVVAKPKGVKASLEELIPSEL